MDKGFVIIKEETLQQLLDNFYEVCDIAEEVNKYEFEDGDEALFQMQEMKDWTDDKFGRTINQESYE
jgi:hypothetical protein